MQTTKACWFLAMNAPGWHKQSHRNIAVCGAIADQRQPWLVRPPANGTVCADCVDD